MKLKCVGLIDTFKDVFDKGASYEASELKNGFCDVHGKRLKKNGEPWLGVMSCGHIVVNGVAKFEIVKEEDNE
ncbi:hypothetical protein [Escherichia phage phiWec190]|uniref:hypothetical protein n=1 Tax=Escherichia coli TaxID=562 RepID=UPI001FF58323|nr:hypothetical protein [Escherichia coli]BDU12065.1 hypothetical protein [Escherichia phage phiWec179]BDU12583.1 hypothetical protein [Escherichia phage phiWec181]BDU12728.1 hypothetical protein [Escherichia phage phiWec186]BDU13236.1 hypothetical protein [Escherichia phage phiWec188]BDU13667.1 hypothetical protein [Escherichia phage phiWec190]